MTNCFWDFEVFLFLVSELASIPSMLSSSSALLTTSYLIFFSLPLPIGVATPIASTALLLIGTTEEAPIIRSHLDQVSGKS